MSWIILRQPHPLDRFWTLIHEEYDAAREAHDAVPDDAPDDVRAAAAATHMAAVHAMMHLPARNFDDVVMKLMVSGIEDGECFVGCDLRAVFNEATDVMDAAITRGTKLKSAVPGLLEGVTI